MTISTRNRGVPNNHPRGTIAFSKDQPDRTMAWGQGLQSLFALVLERAHRNVLDAECGRTLVVTTGPTEVKVRIERLEESVFLLRDSFVVCNLVADSIELVHPSEFAAPAV